MADKLTKEEVNRKLLHIIAVVLPIGIYFIPLFTDQSRTRVTLFAFTLFTLSFLIDIFRLKIGFFGKLFTRYLGSMMRETESKQLTGATYVMAGSLICSVLSLYDESLAASAFIGLTLFILGDAVAALVGKAMGRVKIGDKTLEGALGCFSFCFLLSYFIFPFIPQLQSNWGGGFTFVASVFVSAGVALLELFPLRIGKLTLNDNLYVPGAVSFLAWFIA
jgi:dolichol kinase